MPSSPMLATARLSGNEGDAADARPVAAQEEHGRPSIRRPVSVFHTPTVVGPAVAIQRPSGLNTMSLTTEAWPRRTPP